MSIRRIWILVAAIILAAGISSADIDDRYEISPSGHMDGWTDPYTISPSGQTMHYSGLSPMYNPYIAYLLAHPGFPTGTANYCQTEGAADSVCNPGHYGIRITPESVGRHIKAMYG